MPNGHPHVATARQVVVATVSRAVATTRDHAPFPQAHPLAMDPWMADRMADPDSWQDMGAMVDDWMGEPAGVLCEVDDNLRALDAHADPASFGGGPYPQMRDVDGNYAADGSRFNAIVGDASEAAEARQPRYQNHAMSMSMWLTLAMDTYVDGRLAGDGRRGDRVRPAAATQPRARASSSRRSRFWPHGLATRAGHTGWPHRMATRDLGGVEPASSLPVAPSYDRR